MRRPVSQRHHGTIRHAVAAPARLAEFLGQGVLRLAESLALAGDQLADALLSQPPAVHVTPCRG
jgi:hypothetical protein